MRLHILVLTALMLPATVQVHAADACSAFKWNVSREVALFQQAPRAAVAGKAATDAPAVEINLLYALELQPQTAVAFAAPPSKKMLADGAFGGVLRLRVATAGEYRIAIDAGFWLDIVQDGKPLASVDFNGSAECAGPRKIVVYSLPAQRDLFLQISAASQSRARLTVTPVATPPTP
jgi:hypothetical protein